MERPRNSIIETQDADEELAKESDSMERNVVRKVMKSTSVRTGATEEEVFLWVSQPVKGFETIPHFSCRNKNGESVANPYSKYRFTWYRSRKFFLCNSDACISQGNDVSSVSGLKYQCLTCLQYGNERLSYFCCPECMSHNWKSHCKTHVITQASTVHSEIKLPITSDTTVKDLADFQIKQALNHRSQMEGWEKVSTETFTFIPSEHDVGHKLKVEVTSLSSSVSTIFQETKPVVEPPPYAKSREWFKLSKSVSVPPGSIPLSITSYNMLADVYARPELYSQCPMWALDWTYRRDRLLKQVEERNSDIFCFQEMEKGQYDNFWKPKMEQRGYSGIFTVKTRLLQGSDERVDGCATFYMKSKYTVYFKMDISFNDLAQIMLDDGKINQQQYLRLKRGNIAHVLQMSCSVNLNVPPVTFYLCNSHIFWDPNFSDVKLIQTYGLMEQLDRVIMQQPLPLIICGDFNSEPTSAVYEFMSKGKVNANHPEISNDPLLLIGTLGLNNIYHNLSIRSSYLDVMGKEPDVTNYTDHYEGCLDYIWVSSGSIRPVEVSILPSIEEIRSFGDLKLPNPIFPSDHLALDCRMIVHGMQIPHY